MQMVCLGALKSPFSKGGFRLIIKQLFNPPCPSSVRQGLCTVRPDLKRRDVAEGFSPGQHRLKTCATKTLPYCRANPDIKQLVHSLMAGSDCPTRPCRARCPRHSWCARRTLHRNLCRLSIRFLNTNCVPETTGGQGGFFLFTENRKPKTQNGYAPQPGDGLRI
jgi:hypothetical protein